MNSGVRDTAIRLLTALLLVVLTFPRLDVVSDVGVDNSLAWAFNHFFTTGLGQAAHVVFPHGPLAFIMYPQAVGGDLGAAFAAILLIQGMFLFALLSLGGHTRKDQLVWHAILVAALAALVQVPMQLVGITAAALILHWRTRSPGWAALGVLAALIALHVKAGFGILSCALLAAHAILLLVRRKEWRTVLFAAISFVVGAVLIRWALYGDLTGIGTYYTGLFELSRAVSAATGLHPTNDWWSLLPAIILFIAIPFLTKETTVRHLYALFAFALFAAWKHGIGREDIYHARGLFIMVLLFFGLLILAWSKPRTIIIGTMAMVIVLSYRALASSVLYDELTIAPFGVNRLADWATERSSMIERATGASEKNFAPHRLPEALRDRMRSGTVDVYPWEFSYIPANDLQWRPRPVLQSYASYTPWLDRQNADHFAQEKGADRILWHFVTDRWGGTMGSVDDRYLLNDEPQAIVAMLDNYKWTAGTNEVAILERSAEHRLGEPRIAGTTTAGWNEWIDVPEAGNAILRAKPTVRGTLYRTVKDFFYKDALYTILYRLADGSTRSYRFVPMSPAEGLWVAPFIQNPENDHFEQPVTAIRFQCSEPSMVHDELTIEWELIPLSGTAGIGTAAGLFGKTRPEPVGNTATASVDFEIERMDWPWRETFRTDSLAHGGRYASKLDAGGYSTAYVLALDSIAGPLVVKGSAWLRATANAQVSLVVSVEDNVGSVYWEAVEATDMVFSEDEWWRVSIERKVPVGPGRRLSVYLWNAGTKAVLLDDASVEWSPGLP